MNVCKQAFHIWKAYLKNQKVLKCETFYIFSYEDKDIGRLICISVPLIWIDTDVSLCIQSEYGKIRTRKTPITDTFHAMSSFT